MCATRRGIHDLDHWKLPLDCLWSFPDRPRFEHVEETSTFLSDNQPNFTIDINILHNQPEHIYQLIIILHTPTANKERFLPCPSKHLDTPLGRLPRTSPVLPGYTLLDVQAMECRLPTPESTRMPQHR